MAGVAVSVAVIVRFPAVVSVAWRVFTPFTRLLSTGSVPLVSVLVKCTVPVYPVAMLLNRLMWNGETVP